MRPPIREQFEEAIRMNQILYTVEPEAIKECESIADTQAIEFAKWLKKQTSEHILQHSYKDLLYQFKSDHYK